MKRPFCPQNLLLDQFWIANPYLHQSRFADEARGQVVPNDDLQVLQHLEYALLVTPAASRRQHPSTPTPSRPSPAPSLHSLCRRIYLPSTMYAGGRDSLAAGEEAGTAGEHSAGAAQESNGRGLHPHTAVLQLVHLQPRVREGKKGGDGGRGQWSTQKITAEHHRCFGTTFMH